MESRGGRHRRSFARRALVLLVVLAAIVGSLATSVILVARELRSLSHGPEGAQLGEGPSLEECRKAVKAGLPPPPDCPVRGTGRDGGLGEGEGGGRYDPDQPVFINSLPKSFMAPCPGDYDKSEAGAIDPDSLPPYDGKLYEVQGEWVEFQSTDGITIPAYLSRPADDRRYPGLVWGHGGLFTMLDTDVIDAIAEAGYVALGVDYRGSSGHGAELEQAVDVGGKEVDDILAGGEFLATQPGVVRSKIAVAGGSHGGALALQAAYTDPSVFDAVGDFYGIADWACVLLRASQERRSSVVSVIEYSLGGTPQDVPAEYRRRSPYHNAGGFKVPVYVAHGMLDKVMSWGESFKLVEQLEAKGASVTARFYSSLSHGFIQKEPAGSPLWGDFFNWLDSALG